MLSLYADFPAQFDTGTPLLSRSTPSKCRSTASASNAAAPRAPWPHSPISTPKRRAQELVGLEFRIECDEDEDDEFYLEDLIGFAVTCTEAGADGAKGAARLHRVRSRTTTTATPTRFSSWRSAAARCSSPPAEEFIAHIDFEGRTMKMILPEGLIDL